MSHEFNLNEDQDIFNEDGPFEIDSIIEIELPYGNTIVEPVVELVPIVDKKPIFVEQPLFFYIPDEPPFLRENFKGLEFEGVSYTWDEFDYRLGLEYPSVPEPADAGLLVGLMAVAFIAYKMLWCKKNNLKCLLCKTTNKAVNTLKSIYKKLTGGK